MTFDLLIKPAANDDVPQAIRWYERAAPGLGDDFERRFEQGLDRICRDPASFGPDYRDVYRVGMTRFPYGVFFRLRSSRIVVIAVLHGRQSLQRLKRR